MILLLLKFILRYVNYFYGIQITCEKRKNENPTQHMDTITSRISFCYGHFLVSADMTGGCKKNQHRGRRQSDAKSLSSTNWVTLHTGALNTTDIIFS